MDAAQTLALDWFPKMTEMIEIIIFSSMTIMVTIVIQKVVQMYWKRHKMPGGPFPLPAVGSLLRFRKNIFAHEVINEMSQEHGPVYSLFMGHVPNVIVTDPRIGLQVLKRHQFAGRPYVSFMENFFRKGSIDIVFADFGKEWEALRKVGHSAARKYAVSPSLASAAVDTVDRIIDEVGEQPFDSEHYFTTMMISILAEAAFGKKYAFNDPEFIRWKSAVDLQQQNNYILMIISFVPWLRFVFRRSWNEFLKTTFYQRDYVEMMYKRALERYTEGKIETFCDAIITAEREAELEESWMKPFLHPNNLYNCVFDLFVAGTDTTRATMRWIFILMSAHPDLQQRMREEVESVVGDNKPQIQDRANCHYVCAFIAESMRFRPIIPLGVAHKSTVDTEVDGRKIEANTTIIVSLYNALQDKEEWGDPQVFRPERFLDQNGHFISKPNHFFIPFSDGRRSCPGNKLALNDMFLVLSRFLQRTETIDVVGGVTDDHLKGDLAKTNGWLPINYKLQFKLRQSS